MSAEGKISLWLPEPNTVPHQAAGKLGEELGEAGAIAARILIQGFGGVDPKSGKPNRAALLEELADIEAVTLWLRQVIGLTDDEVAASVERMNRKFAGFKTWQRMIEAHEAGL